MYEELWEVQPHSHLLLHRFSSRTRRLRHWRGPGRLLLKGVSKAEVEVVDTRDVMIGRDILEGRVRTMEWKD